MEERRFYNRNGINTAVRLYHPTFGRLDGIGHDISLSYTKPLGEKLTLLPSLSYVSTNFTEGSNKSRSDKVYNAGISANYALTEWLSIAGLTNFSWKRTSGTEEDDLLEFDDFIGGLSISVNHSF